ncbi:lysoplasmalogenase [Streptomyces sp. NPDC003077]|uniref:lysoplasmalogenase n=1 Tax=Streptomyces sp. NPDC003077 TaxID=3154443 RepID=UPI0033A5BFCA
MTQPTRAVRLALGLFLFLTAAHLAALLTGAGTLAYVTKPALMPVLAGWALLSGAPRPLVVALLFGCGGDALLQLDGRVPFLLGMASFAAGHVCYLVLFLRRPSRPGRRTLGLTAAAYALAWLGTTALLWPGLEEGMRAPVAAYGLLLTVTALGAVRLGARATVGGLLFLLSDTLIAAGVAHGPQLPLPQFWIMLTYTAAQYALADGVRRAYQDGRSRRSEPRGGRLARTGRRKGTSRAYRDEVRTNA